MKKIVALVLSLVMVLGLATTAFAEITLWGDNTKTVASDIYDGEYNTKMNETPIQVGFFAGQTLKYDKTGAVEKVGVIPHYYIVFDQEVYAFVKVDKIPADAVGAELAKYFLVKSHNPKALPGDKMENQTAADAYYILKMVDEVEYVVKAEEFTAWSDDCEAYALPKTATEDDEFYTIANDFTYGKVDFSAAVKYLAADYGFGALVDGEVVLLDADSTVAATQHAWMASKWNEKSVVTEYTCENCKTVGTVINASINAPAGAKIDKLADGTLVAYNFAKAPAASDKVESAQTFDAGIAMYVGMSVMAAAGSAVVLKKKD